MGQGDTALEIAAYYDGRTLTLSEKPDGKWAQTTVPGTLDEMLDDVARRFGLPVPIGDVVYSSPYDAFIGSSTKGGLVGRETIDGVPCAKLDYADEWVQVTLWLPDFRPGAAPPARARLQEVSHPANHRAYFHQLEPRRARHRRDVRVPAARGSCFGRVRRFLRGAGVAPYASPRPAASPAVAGAKPSGEPTAR